jgi:hypothetical protein
VAADGPKHVIERTGRSYTVGVGLKESEIGLLDEWARKYGVTRHGLMVWLLRTAMLDMMSGKIKPEVETKTTTKLRMP